MLSQANRERALDAFRRGDFDVLVATDVAARGLDITDIDLVVNFDVPMHAEDYVHRIGRTGRAHRAGSAIPIVTEHDDRRAAQIERLLGEPVSRARLEGFPYGEAPAGRHAPPHGRDRRGRRSAPKDAPAAVTEAPAGDTAPRPRRRQRRRRSGSAAILLIFHEVQTGFGRTGTLFACEQFVEPDMLCVAKSLAGGIPMGAVLCSDVVHVPVKSHTSTFGGNPLACAAALASLEIMEREALPEKAKAQGEYFLKELQTIKSERIREVRGLGLMLGIELKEKAGPFVQKLMEMGIIVLLAGPTVIRLLPPLVITREEIDKVLSTMKEVLA